MDPPSDPRHAGRLYIDEVRTKFDPDSFNFLPTQFRIDDNYVGEPPHVQVSIENINDNIDENFLRREVAKFGTIKSLEIIRHPKTHQHLGLAKILFEDVSVAQNCVDTFNGKHLMGRQLQVYKDVRFAIIERVKEDKLNPKPLQQQQKPIISHQPPPLPPLPLPIAATHPPILPPIPHPLHKQPPLPSNSSGSIQSHMSIDYTIATPNSITSSSSTIMESTGRQRLEDRIAMLMKQPNCVLSTVVGPTGKPQNSPSFSNFSNLSESSYSNKSFHTAQSNIPLRALDKNRIEMNHRRSENNSHLNNRYQNNKDSYYKHHERAETKSYDHEEDERAWNPEPKPLKDEPLDIELTENEIEDEVLPFCYIQFMDELKRNLISTILKKLRENYGYQCLEKAQADYKAKQDKVRIERDKAKLESHTKYRELIKYMSQERQDRLNAPRQQVVNVKRDRIFDRESNNNRGREEPKRVNRSSAYVNESERRSRHSRHYDSDDESRSVSSSSRSSSSSSYSSSSRSSSVSSTSTSSSSSSSMSSVSGHSSYSLPTDSSQSSHDTKAKIIDSINEIEPESASQRINEKEQDAIFGLLQMRSSVDKKPTRAQDQGTAPDSDEDEIVKPKTAGRKRKKKPVEHTAAVVASEYRASKRFAMGYTESAGRSFGESIENTIVEDDNLSDKETERFIFPKRSKEEIEQMTNDLYDYICEEDLQYLRKLHQEWLDSRKQEAGDKPSNVEIAGFGSEHAVKLNFIMRKQVIDSKTAVGHPKWWRGCSRCDVIEISEKVKRDDEETCYEDLIIAPFKSHVIQAATSNERRDQMREQRALAVQLPMLDSSWYRNFTTLQKRAKNLRFSRSKIHKWGLFACENIAAGEAVIEYVGEKIRPTVADHREKMVYANLPSHDGSSYFFRVETEVIDGTLKGNKARFINHSCNPNCIAKVIRTERGFNSICIYARQPIRADEEITYDYKFPREETDQKIRCNCRAPNCHRYLN